jgi:hypothetical protein
MSKKTKSVGFPFTGADGETYYLPPHSEYVGKIPHGLYRRILKNDVTAMQEVAYHIIYTYADKSAQDALDALPLEAAILIIAEWTRSKPDGVDLPQA